MHSISALSSASSGMSAARLRMEMAAAVLAKVIPGLSAGGSSAAGATAEPDVAIALVDQMLALQSFGMNAAVARTADELAAQTVRLADGSAAR